jgi:hypothetical protein
MPIGRGRLPGLRGAGLLAALAWTLGCGEPPPAEPSEPVEPDASIATVVEPDPEAAGRPPPPEQPGRWRRIPADQLDPRRDAEQLAMIEQLEAIGYASGSVEPEGTSGLERVHPDASTPGYTFMTSGHAPEAFLVDPAGRIVHRWHKSFAAVFGGERPARRDDEAEFWRRARLLANGHVIAIFDGLGMIEVDADSQLVWSRANGAHHDLDVAEDGRIFVLTRAAQLLPEINPGTPILEDFIEILDAKGQLLRKLSLLEAFERSPWADLARARYAQGGDLFHINTLTLLAGRIAERLPAFRAGNVLISSFPMHVIAVVDLDREAVVWLQSGSYRSQHDPQVLDNGNLLLFDNRGGNRGDVRASAVLELDPKSGDERWAYRGEPAGEFYSSTCGTAQRLENGNTLITESDRGRAFEVTPAGRVVWQYRNPHRAGPDGRFIATLFEAWRLPADFPLDWLGSGRRSYEARTSDD